MSVKDNVKEFIERTTSEALADKRVQALLSGEMIPDEVRAFFRSFIVTHLNSVQILSFLYSIVPRGPSNLVKENLLEEMGLEESEKSHPDMLIDLARGLGFSQQDILRLSAEADEVRRRFSSSKVPYGTLKDLGLSILLETVAFEFFLSRVSDSMANAMTGHYGLSSGAVQWFKLHGEVDIKHAEEGKQTILSYVSYFRFQPDEFERIARKTFAENVVLNRYFPRGSHSTLKPEPSGIDTLAILPLHIPFTQTFVHSKKSRSNSDSVIVRLMGSDGLTGYGEALPRPYVTGEDVPRMVEMLRSKLGPKAMKLNLESGAEALEQIQSFIEGCASLNASSSDVVAWNATLCALELALLDWTFKRSGESISNWLAPARGHVVYTGVIDATDPETAGETAARYVRAKFRTLKVKVGLDDDMQRLEAVRKAAGDRVEIRVDANGAWTASEAVSALKRLRAYDIRAVEQPVPASDLEGMLRVRRETGVTVIADESLVTLNDADSLIRMEACDAFNIRVSKCGGLLASNHIAKVGLDAGIQVQVGAQVGETSLLSAAGRHLAAHLPGVKYVEGSFGTHLLSEDISPEPVMFGYEGRGDLLLGEGLGVKVDDEALERLADDIVRVGVQG